MQIAAEPEPYIPIYDLQMFEGPQINTRHIQRELQMAYEEGPPSEHSKPKVFTGTTTRQIPKQKEQTSKDRMAGVSLMGQSDQLDSNKNNLSIQSGQKDGVGTQLRDIYNYKREQFQE